MIPWQIAICHLYLETNKFLLLISRSLYSSIGGSNKKKYENLQYKIVHLRRKEWNKFRLIWSKWWIFKNVWNCEVTSRASPSCGRPPSCLAWAARSKQFSIQEFRLKSSKMFKISSQNRSLETERMKQIESYLTKMTNFWKFLKSRGGVSPGRCHIEAVQGRWRRRMNHLAFSNLPQNYSNSSNNVLQISTC